MHTESRWIKDANNKTFIIHGVSKTGTEYLGLSLETMVPELIQFEIDEMKKWKINTVRIPFRDIHWLYNDGYRNKMKEYIQKFLAGGYSIIIDLHTLGNNPNQEKFLLRQGDSLAFWNNMSLEYKNEPNIMFEIYNEPNNINPIVWWYGNDQYYGFKTMLQEIRSHANNICIIGGLDYSYQWNFLKYYPEIMKEMVVIPNLVLSIHPYGYKGGPINNGENTFQISTQITYPTKDFKGDCSLGYSIPLVQKQEYGWKESFGYLIDHFPVIATEFGLDKDENSLQGGWYPTHLLEYFHNQSIGYVAWAWVQSRLSYPSLLDANLGPVGYAMESPHGPPCGVKENDYYGGPGQLVYQDFVKNGMSRILKESKSSLLNISLSKECFQFIPILLFCLLIYFYLVPYLNINKSTRLLIYYFKNKIEKKKSGHLYLRNRSFSSKLNLCLSV